MSMLAQMSWGQWFLAAILIFVCCFLMLVILLQRGRGSGLTGAFGGAGGSSAFGAKTGDVFTWVTVIVALIFLSLNVFANYAFDRSPKPKVAAQVVEPIEFPVETDTGEVEKQESDPPPAGEEDKPAP